MQPGSFSFRCLSVSCDDQIAIITRTTVKTTARDSDARDRRKQTPKPKNEPHVPGAKGAFPI